MYQVVFLVEFVTKTFGKVLGSAFFFSRSEAEDYGITQKNYHSEIISFKILNFYNL